MSGPGMLGRPPVGYRFTYQGQTKIGRRSLRGKPAVVTGYSNNGAEVRLKIDHPGGVVEFSTTFASVDFSKAYQTWDEKEAQFYARLDTRLAELGVAPNDAEARSIAINQESQIAAAIDAGKPSPEAMAEKIARVLYADR